MKSFCNIMLIVLVAVGMTAGLAAVAQGDTIWGGYNGGGVNAFDMAGAKLDPPSFTYTATQTAGLGLSLDRAILYVSTYGSDAIRTHNTTTGAVIDASFASGFVGNPRGLAVDSSGNIYVGKTNGYVDKIAPNGTHTADWGGRLHADAYHIDVEIVGDYLYAGVILGSGPGVVRYDLSAAPGTNPTQMTTGRTDGIAKGPDGSWYTADGGTGKVYKWNSSWGNQTEIGDVGDCCFDVDYWDGALYACAYGNGIKKCDLSTGIWSDFAPTAGGGYMSTVIMVPEPGTLALLATGLIGLLCYAWRKRK